MFGKRAAGKPTAGLLQVALFSLLLAAFCGALNVTIANGDVVAIEDPWIEESYMVNFVDVEMVSATEGWAIAGDRLYRYDGVAWKIVERFDSAQLLDIEFVAPTVGLIVGNTFTGEPKKPGLRDPQASFWRYNGTSWQQDGTAIAGIANAVSVLGADDAWAVGWRKTEAESRYGTIWHFDGSGWQMVDDPATRELFDIEMLSASSGWAVGTAPQSGSADGIILHYEGQAWTTMPLPSPSPLVGIDMLSITDGWAISSNEVYHYTGSEWAEFPQVPMLPEDATLQAIHMLTVSEGWIVGCIDCDNDEFADVANDTSLLWHYEGGQWVDIPIAAEGGLQAIDLLAANEGWLVGTGGLLARYANGALEDYSTKLDAHPVARRTLTAVSLLADGQAWVVGSGGTIRHFDGSSWRAQSGATVQNSLFDVDMISASDGWAVGQRTGQAVPSAVLLHYNGTAWAVYSPSTSAAINRPMQREEWSYLMAVDMVAADDGWAVGESLLFLDEFSFEEQGLLLHYNGTAWQSVNAPEVVGDKRLADLVMLSETQGYAVGSERYADDQGYRKAVILHYDGQSWQEMLAPDTVDTWYGLTAIDALAEDDLWVLADESRHVHHFDGVSWHSTPISATGGYRLLDIEMVSPTNGWIVGDYGQILHYDGTTWQEVRPASELQPELRAVTASATDGYIVGVAGTIYRIGQPVGIVEGLVFADSNGNGVKDAEEVGVSGATVTLTSQDEVVTAQARQTQTNEQGVYRFEDVPVGSYTLHLTPPAGSGESIEETIEVNAGETTTSPAIGLDMEPGADNIELYLPAIDS